MYNYLCNQWLSPLTLRVRIQLWRGVLDTTLCEKTYQWPAAGRWSSSVSSTNKADRRHDIPEILFKVALNAITLTPINVKVSIKHFCDRFTMKKISLAKMYDQLLNIVWYINFYFAFCWRTFQEIDNPREILHQITATFNINNFIANIQLFWKYIF
jgi:hypothetical protein